jgi:hypothetical protein
MKISLLEVHRLQNQLIASSARVSEAFRLAEEVFRQLPDAELTGHAMELFSFQTAFVEALNDRYAALEKLKGRQ